MKTKNKNKKCKKNTIYYNCKVNVYYVNSQRTHVNVI